MKNIALCIHDLRTSQPDQIQDLVEYIYRKFKTNKLTIHLVADTLTRSSFKGLEYLNNLVKEEKAEIVFHGVEHQCNDKPGKIWSWYHKYEAEFLSLKFNIEKNKTHYQLLQQLFQQPLGICPPCWIANSNGWKFLDELNPLYIEKLFYFQHKQKKLFSSVLSIGSDNKNEIKYLSWLLKSILFLSLSTTMDRIRVVLHVKDFNNKGSIETIYDSFRKLIQRGYQNVLQKELIKS
jgi:hypothetical protein